MKKDIIRLSTVNMSRADWLAERWHGLGGSDIGAVFGIDRFKPAIKLFHQKTGLWPTDELSNIAAYGGSVLEDHIEKFYWRYWNHNTHDIDEMLHNAYNDNVLRKSRKVKAILTNPEYPWLRANIDREIVKTKETPSNGILELKNPATMHWNTYEAGLPPGYYFQITAYMAIAGYEWAELFALKDGRHPEMFPFEFKQDFFESVLEKTKDFWDRVLQAREIVADKSIPQDEKLLQIGPLEPEPEDTKAFEEYMKDRYTSLILDKAIAAPDEIEAAREEYWTNHVKMKEFEKKKL